MKKKEKEKTEINYCNRILEELENINGFTNYMAEGEIKTAFKSQIDEIAETSQKIYTCCDTLRRTGSLIGDTESLTVDLFKEYRKLKDFERDVNLGLDAIKDFINDFSTDTFCYAVAHINSDEEPDPDSLPF